MSGVDAHVGGPATEASEALGASAYATDGEVAFAGAPDLHTAAHEAAHVVQQRRGVQLSGGVGQAGDRYEQHADAVADRVVQGRSAEVLLDEGSSGGVRADDAVQRTPAEALQFDGGGGGSEAGREHTPEADGGSLELEVGSYTQVTVEIAIPTSVPGLKVEAKFVGKYTESTGTGGKSVEAEGTITLGATYQLLFLKFGLHAKGAVKFKVGGVDAWDPAFNRASDDIARWFVARELADLPGKKKDIADEYEDFASDVSRDVIGLISKWTDKGRRKELTTEKEGWLTIDSALSDILQRRTKLIGDIRDIFADIGAGASVVGDEVYPGKGWIVGVVNTNSNGKEVTIPQLIEIARSLKQEAQSRSSAIQTALEDVPALQNDPDTSFSASLTFEGSAEASFTDDASAELKVGGGWRIVDEDGATDYDTEVKTVFFGTLTAKGRIGRGAFEGELTYEGLGGTIEEPDKVTISGKILAGCDKSVSDGSEHSTTVASLAERLKEAGTGADKGGQKIASAIKKSIVREMEAFKDPKWKVGGKTKLGFSVSLEFKRQEENGALEPSKTKVEFLALASADLQVGIGKVEIEKGASIGAEYTH